MSRAPRRPGDIAYFGVTVDRQVVSKFIHLAEHDDGASRQGTCAIISPKTYSCPERRADTTPPGGLPTPRGHFADDAGADSSLATGQPLHRRWSQQVGARTEDLRKAPPNRAHLVRSSLSDRIHPRSEEHT